ncbi:hypothetical protein CBZ_27910 [Cellulomonas biazotea]|uniref:Helix-hairpin-helix DNA-binding motif class 1 domain-containing protein n=1 Tax=Cellulomonas biazotea TaxID=1709 RepID=A0A402DUG3_9CELL|nr:hypothetical protein CBZ_27910 [Cellulomonas biazotea]
MRLPASASATDADARDGFAGGSGPSLHDERTLAAVRDFATYGSPRDLDAGGGRSSLHDERVLAAVRDGYVATYGSPLDLDAADAGPRPVRALRVRWAVSWQLAVTAALVLLLAAGAVALRVGARASGPPVAFPEPSGPATTASPVPGGRSEPAGLGLDSGSGATPDGAAAGQDGSLAGTAAHADGGVVVHVAGAVASPGVVRLAAGSRVLDALTAAGGAAPDADLTLLNLARVLVDGEQVLVSRPGEVPAAAAVPAGIPDAAAPGTPVDLNTADAAALDALPGIGPVLAQRIVEHRAERPFGSVDELADVRGIGPTALERLRDLVRV